MLASGIVGREIDLDGLWHYISLRYLPDRYTLFRGVSKLPAATVAVFEEGRLAEEKYWRLSFREKLPHDEAAITDGLDALLRETVKLHLLSDVPVGTFLSGGIDSSTVTAMIAGITGAPFPTFSIGVKEEGFNELPWARLVAAKYGLPARERIVEADMIHIIPPDKRGSLGLLSRLLPRLRQAFPRARFRVRLDAGFAAPEIFDFLDEQGDVEYAVAIGKNPILLRRAGKHMARARRLSKASGQTEHVYAETRYAAKSWPRKRRIIIKAEVTRHPGRDPKDNPRFVVTNMTQAPRWVYETFYCLRGEIENRIKELHHGLEIDRTSSSRFLANQLRVLLTAAAYVLMQELRRLAARTSLARAQVSTLRERLLKIGARLVVSVRRLVMHLPASYPFLVPWGRIATSLGVHSL